LIRVLAGFANATVTALASKRRLAGWNVWSWSLLVVGGIGTVVGARWGLTGIIYGAMLGWVGRIVVATFVVLPYFQERPRRPADDLR
jgi:hypothetical protein